ncbi:MAG: DUF192 domain-containing protein [Elusimicrobia bacterium]|nr:DUF192 domain-containing protein [Elusimicrobiota bacterium]
MKQNKIIRKKNNKIVLLVILLLAVVLVFALYKYNSGLPRKSIILPNSQKISVEIAADDKSREKGLMFRKNLKQDEGMLFVFKDNSQKHFWMKNTLIDLDIIFIGEDFIINKIFSDVKKSAPKDKDFEIEKVSAKGKYILELAAGSAIKHNLRPGLKIENLN